VGVRGQSVKWQAAAGRVQGGGPLAELASSAAADRISQCSTHTHTHTPWRRLRRPPLRLGPTYGGTWCGWMWWLPPRPRGWPSMGPTPCASEPCHSSRWAASCHRRTPSAPSGALPQAKLGHPPHYIPAMQIPTCCAALLPLFELRAASPFTFVLSCKSAPACKCPTAAAGPCALAKATACVCH